MLEVVDAQADLLEVVAALDPPGRLATLLYGGQQQRHEDADDGDHDEQLDQGEGGPPAGAVASHGSRLVCAGISSMRPIRALPDEGGPARRLAPPEGTHCVFNPIPRSYINRKPVHPTKIVPGLVDRQDLDLEGLRAGSPDRGRAVNCRAPGQG